MHKSNKPNAQSSPEPYELETGNPQKSVVQIQDKSKTVTLSSPQTQSSQQT